MTIADYNAGKNKLFLVVYDIGKPISLAQALVPGARSAPEKIRFWGVREHRESGNTLNSLYLVVAHFWLRIPINYH